jgi:hypothetical protein
MSWPDFQWQCTKHSRGRRLRIFAPSSRNFDSEFFFDRLFNRVSYRNAIDKGMHTSNASMSHALPLGQAKEACSMMRLIK